MPRSLVEVVVSWNLPMHRWLKQYVFKQTRSRLGPGPAVVMTYVASTLLHGLSGQLAAVLLSLGFYTWVEHSIRDKLSNIMEASIGARRETDCRRKVGILMRPVIDNTSVCSASRGQCLGHPCQFVVWSVGHVPLGLPGGHVRPVQP